MGRFEFSFAPIEGVCVVERKRIGDSRGSFSRMFCVEDLAAVNWTKSIAQINHTVNKKSGTVRGMHFQRPPYAEMKLVSCLRGAVWDVAVDLRAGSPTFLKWHAEVLSADNLCAMLIPEGCAHGYQTLTDDVELLYFQSVAYEPSAEGGVNPHDPRIGIAWPLVITEMSARDLNHAHVSDHFEGLTL